MPLDPKVRRFLERLAATNPASALTLSVEERRAGLMGLLSFFGAADEVAAVDQFELPGPDTALTVRAYTPLGAAVRAQLPGMLFFHGGGLVAGTLDTHDPVCRALSNASGCRVLSVDYRLAPEHRFPAAVADGCTAAAWIAAGPVVYSLRTSRVSVSRVTTK